MSGTFDVFFNNSLKDSNIELPLFKEYKINAIDGKDDIEPSLKNGELIILEGVEALKVWVYRALKTKLDKYYIHTSNYGNNLEEHLSTVYNETIKNAIIQQEIIDCLMVNPYLTNAYNFTFLYSNDRSLTVKFNVESVYGFFVMEGVELLGV